MAGALGQWATCIYCARTSACRVVLSCYHTATAKVHEAGGLGTSFSDYPAVVISAGCKCVRQLKMLLPDNVHCVCCICRISLVLSSYLSTSKEEESHTLSFYSWRIHSVGESELPLLERVWQTGPTVPEMSALELEIGPTLLSPQYSS